MNPLFEETVCTMKVSVNQDQNGLRQKSTLWRQTGLPENSQKRKRSATTAA